MKKTAIKEKDNILVFTIDENLTQHDYLTMRGFFTDKYISKGKSRLIIDCEKVTHLPSIAFGVFCSLTRDSRRAGGNCCLVHVSEFNQGIMERTHINKQITILNTMEEAVHIIGNPCQ